MIIEDAYTRLPIHKIKSFVDNGAIVDSWVLTAFFVGGYMNLHPKNMSLIAPSKVTEQEISCVNNILTGFKIKTFIITPHILSEFLNHLRRCPKEVYAEVLKDVQNILSDSIDSPIGKNEILNHADFCDFLNDISLHIASDKQILKYKHTCILSFDGRFINKFYMKKQEVLAFNLDVLKYYYS